MKNCSITDDQDPLDWLNTVLWPDGDGAFVRAPSDERGRWWASPSLATPHTLLPIRPRRVAVRSARRYHDGKGWRARVGVAAAELLSVVPAAGRVGPMSQTIDCRGFDRGVIGGLRKRLGVDELCVAVTLASPKSNRKPVLGLFDASGRRLGFAKVAPDPWVEGLLDNEVRWLGRRGPRPLVVPALVWHGNVAGRQVLVQEAVRPPRLLRRSPTALPPTALFSAVAALGHRRRIAIGESAWFASVRAGLEHATAAELVILEDVLAAGDAIVEVGAWHGDLAAWNLYTGARSTAVIDWEFAAQDAPIGFDVCHFLVQAANETIGTDALTSLRMARSACARPLVDLGVSTSDHEMVWRLYLVELVRRTLALRGAGRLTDAVTHGRAALLLLDASARARESESARP